MEFCKDRVFTSLNADELKQGDKVIGGNTLADLKYKVGIETLDTILDEGETYRFTTKEGEKWLMVLLVERKENCTNCKYSNPHKNLLYCEDDNIPIYVGGEKLSVCDKYEPKTEQKAEPPELISLGNGQYVEQKVEHKCETCKYVNCGFKDFNTKNECDRWEEEVKAEDKWCKNCGVEVCSRAGVDADVRCPAWQPKAEKKCKDCGNAIDEEGKYCSGDEKHHWIDQTGEQKCWRPKAEPHYRPFRDTDELIKVWDAKIGTPNWGTDGDLTMPHIWVQSKNSSMGLDNSGVLITGYFGTGVTVDGQLYSMSTLFDEMVFLDGSPCGVEE